MALIAVAVHDSEENKRSVLTKKTLINIVNTVDLNRHRLFVIDNFSCQKTHELYKEFGGVNNFNLIRNTENIGTAAAINQAWRLRAPGEHCIKMDNDVIIHAKGWVDQMEEAISRDPAIGQVGLKRKDCWETTTHSNPDLRSTLFQLPHVAGERWIVVEKAKHIMGTCVMHSSALLDKVGYLFQPTLYGHDDVLMSWRSNLAGLYTCFLSHIDIDHIDPGDTPYQKWKEDHSRPNMKLVSDIVDEYISGKRSLYYDGGFEK